MVRLALSGAWWVSVVVDVRDPGNYLDFLTLAAAICRYKRLTRHTI